MQLSRSIVVVDDDEWVRRGRVQALDEWFGARATVRGLTHRAALESAGSWSEVDVVVLDAYDATEEWDRFVGCRVARAVRLERTSAETLIVMITGHAHNDGLRLRAGAAGVDWLFAHDDVRSVEELARAIETPAGVRLSHSTAADALDLALDEAGRADRRALFEPGTVQKQVPLGRRQVITLRSRLGRLLGMGPSPSLREVAEVVNHARGVPPVP